jgi:hypothetical protein
MLSILKLAVNALAVGVIAARSSLASPPTTNGTVSDLLPKVLTNRYIVELTNEV